MKKAVCLVVFGCLIRLMAAWVSDFFVDESQSYNLVTAGAGFLPALRAEPHPPLYYVSMVPLAQLTRSTFVLRLPSLICAVLALLINFKLCRLLAGERVALIVLLLSAIVHGFWNFDTLMRMYGLAALLASILIFYLVRTSLDPDWRAGPKETAGFWATCLMLPLVHYVCALIQGLSLVWAVLVLRRSPLDRTLSLPLLLGVLGGVGWVAFALSGPGKSELAVHNYNAHHFILPWDFCNYYTGVATISGWPLWRIQYPGIIQAMGVDKGLGILSWILFAIGARKLWRDKKMAALYLGLLFFTLMVALLGMAYWRGADIFQVRYFITLGPYILLVITLGIESLGAFSNLVLGLLVAINLYVVGSFPGDSYWWNQNWRSVARFVETRAQPGDLLFAHYWYGLVGLDYYLWDGRVQAHLVGLGTYNIEIPTDLPLAAEQPISPSNLGPQLEASLQGKRFFLLLNQPRNSQVRDWFLEHCAVIDSLKVTALPSWGNTEIFLLQLQPHT